MATPNPKLGALPPLPAVNHKPVMWRRPRHRVTLPALPLCSATTSLAPPPTPSTESDFDKDQKSEEGLGRAMVAAIDFRSGK
jgi:hypothetical protein